MNKGVAIGAVAVVVVVAGVALSNGGFFEGGSMSGDPMANCQAACDALAQEIKEKKDSRAKDLIEGAGCSLGSGGEWFGTMAGGYQYTCPTQSAAESLGEAVQDMKDNPSVADREIDDLEAQHAANCPCNNNPPPGGMIRIAPPYLIICPDGTSLSGNPKADENGQPILDAAGNYIDRDTGQSVVCP